jgi:hypothetical protein
MTLMAADEKSGPDLFKKDVTGLPLCVYLRPSAIICAQSFTTIE